MTRHFGSLLGGCQAALLVAAVMAAPAAAADMTGQVGHLDVQGPDGPMSGGPAEPLGGTMAALPGLDWAEPLEDEEMAELRGGFGGFSFSLYFAGQVDNLGSTVGNISINSNGVQALPVGTDLNDLVGNETGGQVFFENLAGSFSNFNGVAQSLNVIGNNNTVQQQMLLQLNIINVTDPTKLRVDSLSGLVGM